MCSVPYLQSLLWKNAGFTVLRDIDGLESLESRYDPTVTLFPLPDDPPAASYKDTRVRIPPTDKSVKFYTVADFHYAYESGKLTPSDVVEGLLPVIRRDIKSRHTHSVAFVETQVDLVKRAAAASTQRYREGKPLGILDGVPFAVKDEMDVKGYKRMAGTKTDFTKGKEVETSWCVRKLEEEGAVCLGKLNMHELGLGK